MNTLYAILVNPFDDEPFVLANATADLAESFQMMQHRAEEWIDEQTAIDVGDADMSEPATEPGTYTIVKVSDTEIRIYPGDGSYTPGQHQALVTFTLTTVSF